MSMSKHDYEFLAFTMRTHLDQIDPERRKEWRYAFLSVAQAIKFHPRYSNFNYAKFIKAADLKEE